MKTLAQLRAANALAAASQLGGNADALAKAETAVNKSPMLIKTCGLLATLAFALKKKEKFEPVANAIAGHLRTGGIAICTSTDGKALLAELAAGDAAKLRRATAEALAFLSFLKRFVG